MDDLREQLQRTLSGSYTIERELPGGGMSRVFVAEETALWSAVSLTNIDLWVSNGGQPLAQAVFHPTRNGSLTFTVLSSPDYAQVSGNRFAARVNCVPAA